MSNPTFKYNPATHSLDEMARMEEPDMNLEMPKFCEANEAYCAHIRGLRSIPCELNTQWSDGELVEGVDFELSSHCRIKSRCECRGNYLPLYLNEDCVLVEKIAIPIKPEADADLRKRWEETVRNMTPEKRREMIDWLQSLLKS